MKLAWILWLSSFSPTPLGDSMCLATTIYLEARNQSLDGQLAMARRELTLLRHGLAQSGALPPPSLKRGAPRWTLWLRLLDARDAGAFADEIGPVLGLADPAPDLAAALAMSRGGYRRILMLGDEST